MTFGCKWHGRKKNRWIHAKPCVVKLEVEAVIPIDAPSEPCYGPATVDLLREVQFRADAGDLECLKRIGDVYAKVPA